jgi:threonine dehydratase
VNLVLVSEAFQETGSFKYRAAWNVVSSVDADLFLAASSGNFGQALARACQLAERQAIVVMPATGSRVKQEAVRGYGAAIEIFDPAESSRAERLQSLAAEHPEGYVASPYDDPLVIEGNASLGREIAEIVPDCQAVIVPVGGGGLACGILVGVRRAAREVAVWGAEPELANDAARSLRSGRLERLQGEPETLADGARTPSLGRHNWPILRDGLQGIVEIAEDHIAEAVRLLFTEANVKAEPTGALAVAALLSAPERFAGQRVVAIVSGGNVDPELYARLITEE